MIDITFWLIESKSKVYAVYLMEPLASQLINKSKKRLLELMKLYICKSWEFRQTHGHWLASLVREDEDQIAINSPKLNAVSLALYPQHSVAYFSIREEVYLGSCIVSSIFTSSKWYAPFVYGLVIRMKDSLVTEKKKRFQ
jgi:hypothetical protein